MTALSRGVKRDTDLGTGETKQINKNFFICLTALSEWVLSSYPVFRALSRVILAGLDDLKCPFKTIVQLVGLFPFFMAPQSDGFNAPS
ncbi:MAG: hypothetical protein WBQ60_04145 [Asticcacaulis sp.]